MNKKYHVSHEGKEIGPLALTEIVDKVKNGEFTVMDYIFDDSSEDWISFVEHSELMSKVKEFKPKAPPKKPEPRPEEKLEVKESVSVDGNDDMNAEWYVLKGESKYGPFAYTDMVKMLQQKVIFEFDFIWKPGFENWQRLADVESYHHDNIKKLQGTLMPEIEDVFFRRRHRRASFNGTLIIHDNNKVWKGQAMEVSAGGAGIIMENALIAPGDVLYLHFKPCDGVPPFNAVCEVVSKKFVEGVKSKSTPIKYGLKFIKINDDAQKAITDFSGKSSKKAA